MIAFARSVLIVSLCTGIASLQGCPPPTPPAPIQPDATDAAPTPVSDASGPPMPGTPCDVACVQMERTCGPQLDDCVQVMAHIERARIKRNQKTGKPLTCMDVVNATTAAEMQAIGVHCGVKE